VQQGPVNEELIKQMPSCFQTSPKL